MRLKIYGCLEMFHRIFMSNESKKSIVSTNILQCILAKLTFNKPNNHLNVFFQSKILPLTKFFFSIKAPTTLYFMMQYDEGVEQTNCN